MRLLDESVKDENPLRRRLEHPEDAVLPLYAEFRHPRGHYWHRSSVRHCNLLPHLQPKKASPQADSYFFRKPANHIPCLWMEDNGPHVALYQI